MVMMDVGNDFYVVRFIRGDDYDRALYGGPWLINDHYLTVQRWYPKFKSDATTLDKLVAWVRFPNLPLCVYDKGYLSNLGNQIGRTLWVDESTFGASGKIHSC